jgi:hypothetical protein
MAALAQLYGARDADFLRAIGFSDLDTGDGTVIYDAYDRSRVIADDSGNFSSTLDVWLAEAFRKDESGRLVHGTSGYVNNARAAGLQSSMTDAHGIDWVRVDGSPDHFRAGDADVRAVYDQVRPEFWGRYDDALGWMQPAALAKALEPITLARKAAYKPGWFELLVMAIMTAGYGAAFAAIAAPAAAGAAGATSTATSGTVAGGSAISTDFALVAAGSNVGIGGVGTAGLGLQVPATLGGTASGLGLASTGATTALLTPELIAAAGNYTFEGLSAFQAAEAAAASGISAPAGSTSWYDSLRPPSTPSAPSGGSGSGFKDVLTTAQKVVGAAGTVGSLATQLGSLGRSSGTSRVSAPAVELPAGGPSPTGAAIESLVPFAIAAAALVGIYALSKKG